MRYSNPDLEASSNARAFPRSRPKGGARDPQTLKLARLSLTPSRRLRMAMFEFRRRSTRRRWVFIGTGTTLVAALLLIVAASSGNLTGSTFEGNDGNLVVDTAGNTDWANVAGRVHRHRPGERLERQRVRAGHEGGRPQGQGRDGSIPPNKNDLTRFYEGSGVRQRPQLPLPRPGSAGQHRQRQPGLRDQPERDRRLHRHHDRAGDAGPHGR